MSIQNSELLIAMLMTTSSLKYVKLGNLIVKITLLSIYLKMSKIMTINSYILT